MKPLLTIANGRVPESEGEANNAVYLTLKYVCGWPMREADWQMIRHMAEAQAKAAHREKATLDEYVGVTLEYANDHLFGRRGNVPRKAYKAAAYFLNEWIAKTTPEERAKTD